MISLFMGVMLIVIATFFGGIGSFLLKVGASKQSRNIFMVYKNKEILYGILIYGFSTILFVIGLKGGTLSFLYPLTSLSYIWGTLLAVKYLKEKMTLLKILGISTIICGIVLIGLGR